MNLSELSSIAPVRMVEIEPRHRFMWLKTVITDGTLALVLNGAVAALVVYDSPTWRIPGRPDAISVELVKDVPKSSEDPNAGAARQPAPSHDDETRPAPANPLDRDGSLRQSPSSPVPPESAPVQLAAPIVPPTPAPTAAFTPEASAPVPPPVEQSTRDVTPRLVEAPPDPRDTVGQADVGPPPKSVPTPPAPPTPTPSPPPPAFPTPEVLGTADAGEPTTVVPPAAAPGPAGSPSTPEEQREAANTAKLAAALPFSTRLVPQTFRTAVAGSGDAGSAHYRGAVYGAFRKANDVIEDARARHLRGQAVVSFTLDDKGALASASVAVSSGNPDVDELALAIVQKSAPYPPPPPGAQRTFAPAIRLGLDDAE